MKRLPWVVLLAGIVMAGLVLASGMVRGALASPSDSPTVVSGSSYAGRGMMGSDGPGGMMGSLQQGSATARTLTIDQAQHRVQLYSEQYDNPHLVIDEVMEFQRNFYAIVKDTSTGHGAFEVLVNKWSGLVFPEYGPAMMWNTQYSMMRGGMGGRMGYRYPPGPMTVSPAQAARIARQWLARHRPGTTPEAPDQFPGYYTIHFRKHGTTAGMLSVNGYSGRIWYHTWHGKFIRMRTING
jgi:hypothetical protein